MTLKTQMATDLAVFMNTDEFADSVTYAGATISAVVIEEESEMTAERTVKRATLFVKESDVSAPAIYDAVEIDSSMWNVIQVPKKAEAGLWKLGIEADERPVPLIR